VSRLALLLVLGAALACTQAAPPSAPPAPVETPAQKYLKDPAAVARGKSVFIGTCGAYCHSMQGVERDAPSLFDCTWVHGGSDEEIFKTISEGVPNTRMPAWKGALPDGDNDIWKVIAFLRSASTCQKKAPEAPH
jgi:mono/diheme cytochrome c family protein